MEKEFYATNGKGQLYTYKKCLIATTEERLIKILDANQIVDYVICEYKTLDEANAEAEAIRMLAKDSTLT